MATEMVPAELARQHREYVAPPLGSRMHSLGAVLQGSLTGERWVEFLHAVAAAIGMTAVGEPAIWNYPVDGKGGTGQTLCLPITESFLALDTWSDHRGAYLFVCSCRSYFSADIDKVATEFGLKPQLQPGRRWYAELNLV